MRYNAPRAKISGSGTRSVGDGNGATPQRYGARVTQRATATGARERTVSVRFSDQEWSLLGRRADAANVRVTTYVRDAALTRRADANAAVIIELRNIHTLLRELGPRIGGPQCTELLVGVCAAIERIAARGGEPIP
jgi:hypothetical protein